MEGKEFIITPGATRDERTVTMTIRIERDLQEKYDELARRSRRSRNELINMALKFAYDNAKLIENEETSQ